jgi:predicted PurR-regulated permease PerM
MSSIDQANVPAASMTSPRPDLGRITLSVLFIGGLIVGSLWILSPFLGAFIWATMIVVATWPIMRRVERLCGGHRTPAVAVMSLGLLAILIVPLGVAVQAIFGHTDELVALLERLPEAQLPAAPPWLGRIPLAGERIQALWNQLASEGLADLMAQAKPHFRTVATWLAQHAGGFAMLLLQFVLIVVLVAVLYAGGESWAARVRDFARRLADEQGDRMVVLAGQAIRGVALGVVVTALAQSALGGIGLAIVGVPFAGVLTAIMFALCIAQLGPLIVLLGATAWAYSSLGAGWGTFMLVWALVVGVMDNFLRPILIKRGADLPLLLIFAGVIGGLVAFGIVGIFVGPVVLAVAYTLLDSWVAADASGSQASLKAGTGNVHVPT